MSFGKLGRPPEDRLARQNEIYEAAAPLILQHGVRGISMQQVAEVSYLSIGGLYYYFPTKRDLMLHGIQPETLSRLCQDFRQQSAHLASSSPQQHFESFYRYLMHSTLFLRPSVCAATEMGIDAFAMIYKNVGEAIAEFAETFRHLAPHLSNTHIQMLAQSVSHFCLAKLIDTSRTNEELRTEFYLLIGGALDREGLFLEEPPF
jgi:AcrR family transcriptional regulator